MISYDSLILADTCDGVFCAFAVSRANEFLEDVCPYGLMTL